MEIAPAPRFNFLDAHEGQRVHSEHFGPGAVVSWDSSWVVVRFDRHPTIEQRVSPFGLTLAPAPAEAPESDHERRARRAKATHLATVLARTDALDDPTVVHRLTVADWELTAKAASKATGTTVRPPHSAATVQAVEMALRGMAAAARVEPARKPADAPGYRRTMAAIAPLPETTEADLFAPFAQADRR